jgi:hypothetical protein
MQFEQGDVLPGSLLGAPRGTARTAPERYTAGDANGQGRFSALQGRLKRTKGSLKRCMAGSELRTMRHPTCATPPHLQRQRGGEPQGKGRMVLCYQRHKSLLLDALSCMAPRSSISPRRPHFLYVRSAIRIGARTRLAGKAHSPRPGYVHADPCQIVGHRARVETDT